MEKIREIEQAFKSAKSFFGSRGVDVDAALDKMDQVSISLPCWQGDDVIGFETGGSTGIDGGIQVTGNFPGRARTADELRMDLELAFSLIPGAHRLNLHAMYGEFGGKSVDRDEIDASHFEGWITWAREKNIKLDFNPTCFSHPLASFGFTLSSQDPGTRKFWIDHVKACRKIAAHMGRILSSPCIHNLWIPDGMKDLPADRMTPRILLKESLDEIYAEAMPEVEIKDSLESKLFGIGSESFVVGSHEFYLGYAHSNGMMLCLDTGHFHPTESVADKISAVLLFLDEILLHLSRGVRWDSDHAVIQDDGLQAIAEEIVRCGAMDRIHLALDFFDASINRVGAWVIGARATLKSILAALLQPLEKLREFEKEGDYFSRLALKEESKFYPMGAVWDYYCERNEVPVRDLWMQDILRYEKDVLRKRSG
jgi:L-rhamnose isomerase